MKSLHSFGTISVFESAFRRDAIARAWHSFVGHEVLGCPVGLAVLILTNHLQIPHAAIL